MFVLYSITHISFHKKIKEILKVDVKKKITRVSAFYQIKSLSVFYVAIYRICFIFLQLF